MKLFPTQIFKNLTALGLVQLTNYILPLIILPYLIKHLGIENYGKIAFVQAVVMYMSLIPDYSFNLTATQEISLSKDSKSNLAEIVTRVYSSKVVLICIAFIILITLGLIFDSIKKEIALYLGGFLFLIGQTIFPVWFFQGIERMKFITLLNLLSKIIYTVLIFVLIRSPSDINFVLLIQGIGSVSASIASLVIIGRDYPLRYGFIGFLNVYRYLKSNFHVFISNISINICVGSNLIILGVVGNDLWVGLYSVAEKILVLVRQMLVVFSQSIFPQMVLLATTSMSDLKCFIRSTFVPFAILTIFGCVLLYFFAPYITLLLTGTRSEEIISIMQILVFIPLVILPQLPYYQTLLALNMKKSILYTFAIVAGFSILINITLTSLFMAYGSALSILLTELSITVSLVFVLEKSEHSIIGAFYKGRKSDL